MEPKVRRQQILEHAAKLFGDRGYHDTSISDIISSAGVARGTFYLYFANKKKLFEELVNSLLLRISSCIQIVEVEPGSLSPKDQLLDNIVRVLTLLGEERHLLSILLKGAVGFDREIDDKLNDFYSKVTKAIQSSLDLGQSMSIVRPCDTRTASLVALGAFKEILRDLLNENRMPESEKDLREIATNVLDIFSKGVLIDGVSIP